MKFCSFALFVGIGVFLSFDGPEAIWTCEIAYKKKDHTLTASEAKSLKDLFDSYEKAGIATTDQEETVFTAPMAVFAFSKVGSETIRYLSFHHLEPFRIEVAQGNNKTRRVISGDKVLLKKVNELLERAFAEK